MTEDSSVRRAAATIFLRYGIFILIVGFLAFALSGFAAKAKSGLMMGGGCCAIMLAISYLARQGSSSLASGAVVGGTVLTAVFAGVFMWRAALIFNVEEKRYLLQLLLAMFAGSLVALFFLLASLRANPSAAPLKKN